MIGAFIRAGIATAPHLIHPRAADQVFLTNLEDAGMAPTRSTVRLMPLIQAQQNGPTALIAEGIRHPKQVRMSMTTFVVEHREARFLIDPSMCADVHDSVLTELAQPYRMTVAPERPVIGLAQSLEDECGLAPERIDFVIPTHLHWDHIAGLYELPQQTPVLVQEAERAFALAGKQVPYGVARGPLRNRKFEPYELDGPPCLTFARSRDVFGDGSVIVVDLQGHTPGSVGLLLNTEDHGRVLIAGDAVWHSIQIDELRQKAPLLGDLVDADREETFKTIHRLSAATSTVPVIPVHDHGVVSHYLT
ncbi:MAG: MBL fold metallo-hydrolase [Rhodococcus sp.]|nr:MBL fold metallo-hydrolase [Rhodococcus sp. (in: high G+C Gram-positive bacteria)]